MPSEKITVVANSNDKDSLEKLINELYPNYNVTDRGIVRINYYTDSKYSQTFTLDKKRSPEK